MEDGLAHWARGMEAALTGSADATVACGPCTACCASSQFVVIEPDETETLAHIPAELLFPAPRRPNGWRVLGYDADGRCPMLADAGCSIYPHRPRTCRTFDCRIYPATGTAVEASMPLVASRAGEWVFVDQTPEDEATGQALRSAADFLRSDAGVEEFGDDITTATGIAVTAVRIHRRFLGE